jgi:hypothetical protein
MHPGFFTEDGRGGGGGGWEGLDRLRYVNYAVILKLSYNNHGINITIT